MNENTPLDEEYAALKKAFQGAKKWREFSKDNFIQALITAPGDFELLYEMLEDQESRDTFDWLVGYRFLAPLLGETLLWENPSPSPLYRAFPGPFPIEELYNGLKYVNEHKNELPIPFEPLMCVHTFYSEQYAIDGIFEAKESDIIFDLGGYIGDTALYFSPKVSVNGKIYVFEPQPWMQARIHETIERFNLRNVEVIPYCASDANKTLYMNIHETLEHEVEGTYAVNALRIDDFVEEKNIYKVDLIKMDIEGGETAALKGATRTIERFRPKLAISVYHRGGPLGYEDLHTIPPLIKSLCPGYKFYLRHKNAMLYETILFCVPRAELSEKGAFDEE